MKRAIVTGATGDIGVALAENLAANGVEVLALARKNSARAANIPRSPLVRVEECDLSELKELSFGEKYDVFFHLGWQGSYGAARNDCRMQADNISYTLCAVEAAARAGCNKFVGAGSQAEYGRAEGVLSPSAPAFPESAYGIAKLAAGRLSAEYCSSLGMDFCWARILSVYGPYGNNMIAQTLKRLLNGERAPFTKGEQLWDFLHCDDAAEALRLIAERGRNGAVYVLGSGVCRPLCEYVYELAEVAGAPDKIDIGALPYADRQVMKLCADIASLTADTGWKPRVAFKDGVKKVKEEICMNSYFRGGGRS